MLRRIAVVAAATAALLVPAGAALAVSVDHPGAGAGGCGVQAGTVTVLDPGGPVFEYSGGGAQLNCL